MKKIAFMCLYFGLISALICGDMIDNDEIIKLNVGGKIFQTYRSNLTAYPQSMLGKMFNKDSEFKKFKKTEDGCIFLDANPAYFEIILDFLRDGSFNISDIDLAKKIRPTVDNFCHPLCELIDEFILKNSHVLKLIEVNEKGVNYWRISHNGLVLGIGRGFERIYDAQIFLRKYENQVNKDLIFLSLCDRYPGPSAVGIFNVNNSKLIGKKFPFPSTEGFYSQFFEINETFFPTPDPIEEAIKLNEHDYYVCSSAGDNKFAIFNAITGKIIRPKEEYQTLPECIETLKRYVDEKILPETH